MISGENRLLLDSVRPGGGLRGSFSRHIDWEAFQEAAYRHGLVPLAFRRLLQASQGGASIPRGVLDRLRDGAEAIATQNLMLSRDLIRVAQAFHAAGIEMIAYKGPVLAARAYGDIALRHFADLDILVRRAALSSVADVMLGLGYRSVFAATEADRRGLLRWGHHDSFISREGTLVEVHWRFSKPLFGFAPSEAEIWRRPAWSSFGPVQLRVLPRVHDLLVIITHAAGHGWRQLSWLVDFDRLVRLNEPTDYTELLSSAERLRCRRQVLLAFALGRDLLTTPVPEVVERAVASDPAVPALQRSALQLLLHDNPTAIRYAWLQIMLREGAMDRLRFFGRAAFAPTPVDLTWVRFPPILHPLYYFVRPLRLAMRMGSGWARALARE